MRDGNREIIVGKAWGHTNWKTRRDNPIERKRFVHAVSDSSTYLSDKINRVPPPVIIRRKFDASKSYDRRHFPSETPRDAPYVAGSDSDKIAKRDSRIYSSGFRFTSSCNDHDTIDQANCPFSNNSLSLRRAWNKPRLFENVHRFLRTSNRPFEKSFSKSSASISSSSSSVGSASCLVAKNWYLRNNEDSNEESPALLPTDNTPDDRIQWKSKDKILNAWPKRSLQPPNGQKLATLVRKEKNSFMKSGSTSKTFVPTKMTCIKASRAMSENRLGQIDTDEWLNIMSTSKSSVAYHPKKSGSLKDERLTTSIIIEVPPQQAGQFMQRWSSVRVKGDSTKSLLLENGGPQVQVKEVLNTEV